MSVVLPVCIVATVLGGGPIVMDVGYVCFVVGVGLDSYVVHSAEVIVVVGVIEDMVRDVAVIAVM